MLSRVLSGPCLGEAGPVGQLGTKDQIHERLIEQGLNLVEGPVVTKWVAGLGTEHKDFPESMASGFGPQGTES